MSHGSKYQSYLMGDGGRSIASLRGRQNDFKQTRASRENLDMLPGDAVVRVIRPDAKWNQTTFVSSHDTIAAYFLSEGATAKLYKVSSGRYFTLVIFIFTLGLIIDSVRNILQLQIPDWFWIITAINLVWASSTIILFSNRFLLLETLRCFETWYVCLQGMVSSICVIHGRWDKAPIFACYNGLVFFLCYFLLSVCDAFNPQHKSIALRITLAAGIIVLAVGTYSHVHGSYPLGFQVKEYRFGSGWTTTNTSLLIRCNLVIILFLLKFLFRMVMFPDKLVIIRSDMVNNKRTMSELQKELSETRMKHRTSQLPSMKMQHQIRKDSSQARLKRQTSHLFQTSMKKIHHMMNIKSQPLPKVSPDPDELV